MRQKVSVNRSKVRVRMNDVKVKDKFEDLILQVSRYIQG